MPDDVEDRDRAAAHVAAYELAELAQTDSGSGGADLLLAFVLQKGWHEVACLLEYGRHIRASALHKDASAHLRAMRELAERDGDPALLALVMATEVESGIRDGSGEDDPERGEAALARAVAILRDGGGRAVDRPAAYIICALVYSLYELPELEAELYAAAVASLDQLGTYPRIRELDARVIVMNRVEAQLLMACECDEAGDRPGAAALAAKALDTPIPDLGDVPQDWLNTLAAMRGLLAALAYRPAPESPTGYPEVHGSRGYALLAEAVRHRDAGDAVGAAEHAVRATEDLKASEMVGALRHYAMALAACHPPPAEQARRYVESLVRRRRESRQRALGSARARIEAERIRLENERLAQRAYVDELTGLANRHAYTRYLKRLASRPADRDIAVLAVDLDLFKLVNDRFGHAVGDEVLRQVAGLLSAGVRPTDLVARLGGDEFVVIMDAVGELDAVDRGRAVVDQVADHSWGRVAAGLQVTVSVGAAAGPGARIMGLLQDADRGLYVAKASGRGRLGLPPPRAVSAG